MDNMVEVRMGDHTLRFPAHYEEDEHTGGLVLTPDHHDDYVFRRAMDGHWYGMQIVR